LAGVCEESAHYGLAPWPLAPRRSNSINAWSLVSVTCWQAHSGYTTTLKQMQLMTEKGLLIRSERFRSHVYEAGFAKEQTQLQIAGDVLKRAFEGSATSLVLGALSAKPASDEELAEIRRMLDRFEKGKGKR
jgi:predicted transcriptional regulator